MKNIYIMIVATIVLFVISMDYIFVTNIFIDLLIVIVYLILVARSALKLETNITKLEGEHTLKEKKMALFAPLIFLFFLSTSISFGIIVTVINILVIVLLYVYIVVSITRNRIVVTTNAITAEYLNGHSLTMKWVDIIKVDFDWIYNMLVFTDNEGTQLKLDISLSDFLLVIIMMKERLLKDDYEIAFGKLKNYYLWFLMNSNNVHLK